MASINIVFPMNGLGTRFGEVTKIVPKPLLPVDGRPMIERVVVSLGLQGNHYFLCRREQRDAIENALGWMGGDAQFITVKEDTKGPVETVLHLKNLLNSKDSLVIADCDSIVPHYQYGQAIQQFLRRNADCGVTVQYVPERPPHLSYIELAPNLEFGRVAEKEAISDFSSTGPYWWRQGRDFVAAATAMIKHKDSVNGEYYVAPVYNYLKGRKVAYLLQEFWHLGTPEELQRYQSHLENPYV